MSLSIIYAITFFSFFSMVYLNTTINVGAESLNFPRLRNNMLRIYVFGYQNTIKKRLINKFGDWISKTTDTVNFYLMDANCKYNSLSEEDKIIIETAISLLY